MNTYYNKAVKEDIEQYLKDNADVTFDDVDDLRDTLDNSDYITGNMSGSYFCNSAKARQALEESNVLFDEDFIEYLEDCAFDLAKLVKEPESLDVIVRCWTLGEMSDDELWKMYEDIHSRAFTVYEIKSETFEAKASKHAVWSQDDFRDVYNESDNEPATYRYFSDEKEASKAWQGEKTFKAYRQHGQCFEFVFFEVLTFEKNTYYMPENIELPDADKLDDAMLRHIAASGELVHSLIIDTKISEGESEVSND